MKTITVREFRNDSGRVLKEVSEGQSFTITSNGHPVADLYPHHAAQGPRRFVPLVELIGALSDLPVVDASQWLADAREGIDQEVDDPWERRAAREQVGEAASSR